MRSAAQLFPGYLKNWDYSNGLSVPNSMLSWDEIKQMSKQKITFGAHTISHPALSRTIAAWKQKLWARKTKLKKRWTFQCLILFILSASHLTLATKLKRSFNEQDLLCGHDRMGIQSARR